MIRLRIGLAIALGVQVAAAAGPQKSETAVDVAPDRVVTAPKGVPPVMRRLEPPDSVIVTLPGPPGRRFASRMRSRPRWSRLPMERPAETPT